MKLRMYQKKALKALKKKLKKHNHVLFMAPTGAGKTVMFSKLCSPKRRTLILVPRIALLKQITDTLRAVGYEASDICVHHGNRCFNRDASVHVAMINTFHKRLDKFGDDYIAQPTHVILDEVHIGHAKSMFNRVKEAYWDTAKWIGFSATPIDDRGYMLKGWDDVVTKIQLVDLVEQGYLLPIKIYKEKSPNLNNVHMVGGDYNQKELAEEMAKGGLVSNAYDVWASKFSDKKTMVFCVNIDHAELVAYKFREHNVPTVVSHSKNSDGANDAAHKAFSSGHAQVLVSINKLTAGFDEPSVEVLLALRPTKTKSLYLQAVGRVLRPHPSMNHAILIDCAGWLDEFGHPFIPLELKEKPKPKERKEGKEKPKICVECEKECEFIIETEYDRDGVLIRKLCNKCGALNDEQFTEYRDIGELEEVPDPLATDTVTSTMVGNFVEEIRRHKQYKPGWVRFVARDAKKYPEFMDFLKVLHNKNRLGMINYDTALKHINKERAQFET